MKSKREVFAGKRIKNNVENKEKPRQTKNKLFLMSELLLLFFYKRKKMNEIFVEEIVRSFIYFINK